MSIELQIVDAYRRLQGVKRMPEWYFTLTLRSASEVHYNQYLELHHLVGVNEDVIVDLFRNRTQYRLTEDEIFGIFYMGMHGGSVSYEDNMHWHSMTAKLRKYQDELPENFQSYLDWLLRVHGW